MAQGYQPKFNKAAYMQGYLGIKGKDLGKMAGYLDLGRLYQASLKQQGK